MRRAHAHAYIELRGAVSDASDGVQNACGPISAIQAANQPQTRTSIEFPSLAVFVRPGSKPANPVRTQVRTFPLPHQPAQAHADSVFGLLARTAGCEPQTLQTLFSDRTVARYCARAPPYLNIARKDPFCLGHVCVRGP